MNKIIGDLIDDYFYDDGYTSFNQIEHLFRSVGLIIFSTAAMHTIGSFYYLATVYSGYILIKKRLRYLDIEMNFEQMVLSILPLFRFLYMGYIGLNLKRGNNLSITKYNIIEIDNKFKLMNKWINPLQIPDEINKVNVDFKVTNHFYSNNDENKCLYFVLYEAINGALKNKPIVDKNESYVQLGDETWKCRKFIYDDKSYQNSAFKSYDSEYVIADNERILCCRMTRVLDNGNMIMYVYEEIVKITDSIDIDNFGVLNYINIIKQGN